jgi:hypothetical protein
MILNTISLPYNARGNKNKIKMHSEQCQFNIEKNTQLCTMGLLGHCWQPQNKFKKKIKFKKKKKKKKTQVHC